MTLALVLSGLTNTAPQGGFGSLLGMFFLPILLLVGMYFLMVRPQKKAEKRQKEERDAMRIGDHVVTIGGVVGRVTNLKDDEVTISTSVACTLLTFRKEAISQVIKPNAEASE